MAHVIPFPIPLLQYYAINWKEGGCIEAARIARWKFLLINIHLFIKITFVTRAKRDHIPHFNVSSTWLTNVLPKSRFVYYYYYYYYYGFTEAQTIGNEWSERKGEVR